MDRPSWFQALLLVAVAVLATLLVVREASYPPVIRAAGKTGANKAASSGHIIAIVGGDGKDHRLYLIDTEKQRICVYRNIGDRFRVVGMRTYRFDLEFDDSSLFNDIESGRGATATRIRALLKKRRGPTR